MRSCSSAATAPSRRTAGAAGDEAATDPPHRQPGRRGQARRGARLSDDPERLLPRRWRRHWRAWRSSSTARGADDAGEIARQRADAGSDVVVAGGDGTVSRVATALVGHPEATLGILALRQLQQHRSWVRRPGHSTRCWRSSGRRSGAVDCGWVVRDDGGLPFFEAAGIGLNAVGFLAASVAERQGWWSALRALWIALRLRRTPMRLTIDGRAYRTGTPAVTISNGPYHGPGFAISPEADPTDGMLDVAVFRGMSRWEVLAHFLAVARRRRGGPRIQRLSGAAGHDRGHSTGAAGPRRQHPDRHHPDHDRGASGRPAAVPCLEVERRPEEAVVGREREAIGHARDVVGRLLLGGGGIATSRGSRRGARGASA